MHSRPSKSVRRHETPWRTGHVAFSLAASGSPDGCHPTRVVALLLDGSTRPGPRVFTNASFITVHPAVTFHQRFILHLAVTHVFMYICGARTSLVQGYLVRNQTPSPRKLQQAYA